MKAPLIVTLLTGGLASLDATPVAQTLASQPLVTATILGAVWGDWSTAMAVGTVLQILAASTLPIGARTPEDYAVG
ncbi:MAG: system sorbose-specific iic component, partial [Candidatus Eisenbacteria bacterium]